jgi:hypothetical protein
MFCPDCRRGERQNAPHRLDEPQSAGSSNRANRTEADELWGAMRGTAGVASGVDQTQRTGEVWQPER